MSVGQPAISLSFLTESELPEAVALCQRTFADVMPPERIAGELRSAVADYSVGLRENGRLVGVYLGSTERLPTDQKQFKVLASRPAFCGLALAVEPQCRGRGLGRLLRNAFVIQASSCGAAYVWGMALSSLGNSADWAKRRITTARSSKLTITAEPLTPDLRAVLASHAPHLQDRWRREATPSREAVSGVLVIQKLSNGHVVPWVYSAGHAVSLPESAPKEVADLEGADVVARGRLGGDRMAEATLIRAQEPARAFAP